MSIKRPDWLPPLTPREEKQRAAAGLVPKRDGWYKSINGKATYITRRLPLREALELLPARRAEITGQSLNTVTAAVSRVDMTLEQLVEVFLASMLSRVQTGVPKKMSRFTYDDFVKVLFAFVEVVGGERQATTIGPTDFSAYIRTIAARAASTRMRHIQCIDRLFNWAGPGRKAMNLIPYVQRGADWIKPSASESRQALAGLEKAYTPEQVTATFELVKDNPFLNATAHLGLNCGFIPKDVADLPEASVDLDQAMILFPRGKTGMDRICPLVPETVRALRTYLRYRAKLKRLDPRAQGLFFRTRQGLPYARQYVNEDLPEDASTPYNRVGKQWSATVGLPYTGLRSTLATLADGWPDERAIDLVLGHKVGLTGDKIRTRNYAKYVDPERVRKLVDYVWPRAFGQAGPPSAAAPSAPDAASASA
jgi:integrase